MKRSQRKRPAVFLDRDGTINEEYGYVNHVSRIRLIPGVARAIRRLNEAGVPVIVVSNQAGVAQGYFPEQSVRECNARIEELLTRQGARVDAIYTCPYHPSAKVARYRRDSPLRKPRPGMLDKAAREHGLDLARSYMAGDRPSDVECAKSRGLKAILLRTGYGEGEIRWHRAEWKAEPDLIAKTLNQAVTWILRDLRTHMSKTAEGEMPQAELDSRIRRHEDRRVWS